MTTRADLDRLSAAQREVVELARRDLVGMFATMDLSRPERVRDFLLEVVPMLVREYGEIAATAAAEWYEEARAAQVGGRYAARLGDLADPEAVTGTVRWAAGHLFTDTPGEAVGALSGALQRYVMYSGRRTVARNIQYDPSRPRFGRVPTGERTCAFCEVMASRGFVYYSKLTAGDLGRGVGEDFHDDCDCQVVGEWDAEQHHIAGYDPDAMYERYGAARDEVGEYDLNAIVATMRRKDPDLYTDGVLEVEDAA